MKQIIAPLFKQNQEGTWDCVPSKPLNCDNMTIEGIEWFTPNIVAGVFKGYDRSRGTAAPQTDSVKTVRIRIDSQTYWVAIANGDTEAVVADACNACCAEGTPVMVAPTIPEPLVEDCICKDSNGNYVFLFPFPPVIAGQTVTAKTTSNGVAQTTSPAQASAASLRTWLAANLGAMGTWSVDGPNIKLTSTTVSCASQVIDMVEHPFCLDTESITFPAVLTSAIHNGVTSAINNVTVNSLAELIAAVAYIFADGTMAVTLDQVNYIGTGVPTSITTQADGAIAFSAGDCIALGGGSLMARRNTASKSAPAKKARVRAAVNTPRKAAPKKAAPKKAAKKAAKKSAKKK